MFPFGRVSTRPPQSEGRTFNSVINHFSAYQVIPFFLSFEKILEDISPFYGPLISLFWTSSDVSCGFQNQSEQPYSCLADAYMLHNPWDSPLVQHLLTSWQPLWQPSHSFPHTWEQALLGLKNANFHAATNSVKPGRYSTDWARQLGHFLVLNI